MQHCRHADLWFHMHFERSLISAMTIIVVFLDWHLTIVTSMTLIHYVWLVTFFIRGDNDDGNNPYQLGLLSYGLATAGQNCSYLSHSMHPHFKTFFSLHCVFWDNHIYLCTFNFLLAPKLMWIEIFHKGKLWQSHSIVDQLRGLYVHCIFSAYHGSSGVKV